MKQRSRRENNARRITSRTGNQIRRADLFAIPFRQSVNSRLQQFRRGMIRAVVLSVLLRGFQAEICTDVNRDHPRFRQGNGKFRRKPVRQSKKRRVALFRNLSDIGSGKGQSRPRKPRKNLRNILPRILTGGNDFDLHLGMTGQKPQKLFSRITGRTHNPHTNF